MPWDSISASELGESDSGMKTGGSLLSKSLEICGALSHIHAVTGLRFFLQLLRPGLSKGLQQD